MNQKLLYLDSSAIVKLVVMEAETAALMTLLSGWPERVCSELARTEVLRALRRAKVSVREFRRGEKVLNRIGLIRIDKSILLNAAMLQPAALRTLDAIHLATSLSIRTDLGGVVTYDRRLAEAAANAKLSVWSPH